MERHEAIDSKAFLRVLKQRTQAYFREGDITMHANNAMWAKAAFWFACWGLSLGLIYFSTLPLYLKALIGMFHLFTQLMLAFNVAHDANHNALSASKKWNAVFSYTMDLCGSDSLLWKYNHNVRHHVVMNIDELDDNIETLGLLRCSPYQARKPLHRFQHYYAPLVYGISTLAYVTVKDIFIYRQYLKTHKTKRLPKWLPLRIFLGKLFYHTYTLLLPVYVLQIGWWPVLAVFLAGHFINGNIVGLVFQTAHLNAFSGFPSRAVYEQKAVDWPNHVLQTTTDVGTESRTITWLTGGLNIHTIHHFFPTICHVHYRRLLPIIKATAAEFHLDYKEIPGFRNAVRSHFRLLRRLGKPDSFSTKITTYERATTEVPASGYHRA